MTRRILSLGSASCLVRTAAVPTTLCQNIEFSAYYFACVYLAYLAKGLEVRRENPFPTSSERGALEAAAAAQKALVAGKRGLIIDVEVQSTVLE